MKQTARNRMVATTAVETTTIKITAVILASFVDWWHSSGYSNDKVVITSWVSGSAWGKGQQWKQNASWIW